MGPPRVAADTRSAVLQLLPAGAVVEADGEESRHGLKFEHDRLG